MRTMDNSDQVAQIKEIGKLAQGRRQMLKHLEGGKNTRDGAIKAFCYYCMGYCADEIRDCETPGCPLYPFNPYNPKRPRLSKPWVKGSKTPGVKKTTVRASKV